MLTEVTYWSKSDIVLHFYKTLNVWLNGRQILKSTSAFNLLWYHTIKPLEQSTVYFFFFFFFKLRNVSFVACAHHTSQVRILDQKFFFFLPVTKSMDKMAYFYTFFLGSNFFQFGN